ncbi:MAG: hypothetical protein K6E30_05640 [Lachnospiraceae bacterium]|nr:hypothetical protein [Lachnospiraceae bacterium]
MKSKLLKKLAASAIAAAMAAAMLPATALAAPKDVGLVSVALCKNFQIGAGITVPDVTFSFTIRQTDGTLDGNPAEGDIVSEGGNAITATTAGEYYLAPVELSYSSGDRASNNEDTVLTKQAVLFQNVTYPAKDTQATYYFQVKEDIPNPGETGYTYDETVYYVTVTVPANNGTPLYTVATNSRNKDTEGGKIDGTPQNTTNDQTGGTDANGDSDDIVPNEFVFTNTYVKDATYAVDRDTDEEGPSDPRDQDATDGNTYDSDNDPDPINGNNNTINDVVGGEAAFTLKKVLKNPKDAADTFTFNLAVTYPVGIESTATYETKLNGVAGNPLKSGDNEFTLGNNGVLEVETLPAGTKIVVTETGVTGYQAKTVVSYNGTPGGDTTGARGANVNATVLVGENGGYVSFINNYSSASPTGILMTNLPFTLLILVALIGFAGYIYSQRRRAAMNDMI